MANSINKNIYDNGVNWIRFSDYNTTAVTPRYFFIKIFDDANNILGYSFNGASATGISCIATDYAGDADNQVDSSVSVQLTFSDVIYSNTIVRVSGSVSYYQLCYNSNNEWVDDSFWMNGGAVPGTAGKTANDIVIFEKLFDISVAGQIVNSGNQFSLSNIKYMLGLTSV
jgi:hypothetical protein